MGSTRHTSDETEAAERTAREISAETLTDVRSGRREMRAPGSVRGLAGVRIRAALARRRATEAA